MTPSIDSFMRAARFKAVGTIVALAIVSLLAALLIAGLAIRGSRVSAESKKGGGQPTKSGPATSENAAVPDTAAIADSVSVQIVAPKIVAPSVKNPTPPQQSITRTENESWRDPATLGPQVREIEMVAQSTPTERLSQSLPDEDPLTKSTELDTNSKTNTEPVISVKCDYDFVAIQKSLQAGRGELVALCRRAGARDSLMLISRTSGAKYQLRTSSAADNLANLGLRLHSTDGDLAELERRIRHQTGMESVVFYFAPSTELARTIVQTQETALEAFRRGRKASESEALVLSGRFSCTSEGLPAYTVTGVSPAN